MTNAAINIEDKLNQKTSKLNTLILTNFILEYPDTLEKLYQFMLHGDQKIQWKAAWVFEHVFVKKPESVNPYIQDLVSNFISIKQIGVKRHIAKILSLSNINHLVDGNFINQCIDIVISEQVPVAVKAHVMQILFNITKTYPELKPELKLILEEQIPYNSVGFKSKAKKLIRLL